MIDLKKQHIKERIRLNKKKRERKEKICSYEMVKC